MSASDRPHQSRAPSRRAAANGDVPPLASQLDLFPVKPIIDVLDPHRVVGNSTSVEHLVRVRFRPNDAPHLVFHDRHGWYCESHGPACSAVRLAREATG